MNGETTEQLVGFVTGEGGTGKSMLIQTLKEYCQLTFGKQEGIYGSALAMAPTGCAASNIEGYTWQSITCCGFSTNSENDMKPSQETARLIGEKIKGVKLMIFDEVSMLSFTKLAIMEARIIAGLLFNCTTAEHKASIATLPFGGINMLFVGDLWQLGKLHTYIHTYIYIHIHACMHTHIHSYIHRYAHTYMHAYIYT